MTLDYQSQSPRLSTCHRHPAEPVTGFCASCLRERLAGLEESPVHPESSSSLTTFKAILESSGSRLADRATRRDSVAGVTPELRRSKSCSARRCRAPTGASEPRRKSCDDRGRNSLQHLFSVDDGSNEHNNTDRELRSSNLGFPALSDPIFESREEKHRRSRVGVPEDVLGQNGDADEHRDEEVGEDLKTMKEHIDLELRSRKQTNRDLKDIAGNIFAAASVFSKKLQKWKQKQKIRKRHNNNGDDFLAMEVEKKPSDHKIGVADYRLGRRSCDVDPRFSIDPGRTSFDEPRFSLDEHRASWDGYLIARTIPRLTPMLSVIENAIMAPANGIPVEEQTNIPMTNEDETTFSSGSMQTRDYCSDSSSSQRGSSFDCSSSVKSSTKRTSGLEVDDEKSAPNTKVSPSPAVELFHGSNLLTSDREFGDLSSYSVNHGVGIKSLQSAPKNVSSAMNGGNLKGVKKSFRWQKVLNIRGYFNGGDNSHGDAKGNAVEPPPGGSCEKREQELSEVVKATSSPTLIRNASCVSARRSFQMNEPNNLTRGATESARKSLSELDNSLLRFQSTPSRSYRSKSGKNRLSNSSSVARRVFGLN